jgi:ketosteroid isomerase-like protein
VNFNHGGTARSLGLAFGAVSAMASRKLGNAGALASAADQDRCHDLAVHRDRDTGVVVLEYASQGRVVATGATYRNRYISVLTVVDRKVTRWRDYLDPVAVFDAVGWPARGN